MNRLIGNVKQLWNRSGFTLIELMIVVAIMGILASIAAGFFLNYTMKAKQSEARTLLSAIYTVESAYFSETNSYGSLSSAGFMPSSSPKYYTNVGSSHFDFSATGFVGSCSVNLDRDITSDVWEITEASRSPVNVSNDVEG